MKILLINDVASGGGAERVMHDLLAALCRSGNCPTVLCTNSSRCELRMAVPRAVSSVSLSPLIAGYHHNRLWRVVNKLWRFYKLFPIRRTKWNVILALKEGEPMILADSLHAEKKIGWVHVDYRFLYWTKTVFGSAEAERTLMQQLDSIVCVSQAAADGVCAVIGDPGNLCVRYNPLDVSEITRKSLKPIEFLPQRHPVFVAVGRLVDVKNFRLLIMSAISLLKDFDFELQLIGDGPLRGELEELVESAGESNRIRFFGAMENPYPQMSQADWFISSSLCESYGLAIQEALILGVPVITTSCPAIREVCDERFSLICDNSQSALTATMKKVLSHPEISLHIRDNIKREYPGEQDIYHGRIKQIIQLWNPDDE